LDSLVAIKIIPILTLWIEAGRGTPLLSRTIAIVVAAIFQATVVKSLKIFSHAGIVYSLEGNEAQSIL
jgi:hypothetical protein